MYRTVLVVFSILFFASEISSKKLPDGLQRCSKSSPEFISCLKRALPLGLDFFADGYPELGIPRLEPFMVKSLDLGDSNTGSVKLHQVYENLNMFGMAQNAELMNFEGDFSGENCFWRFNAVTPVLRMEADYKITGQLLVFPINGHGRCNNSIFEMDVHHEMTCERYEKKGKKYLKVTSYSFDIRPKNVSFFFDNIIDGNPELTAHVVQTINENALSVFADVRDGFQKAFSQIWLNVGNSVFSKIPEDEVFLP